MEKEREEKAWGREEGNCQGSVSVGCWPSYIVDVTRDLSPYK